MITIKRSTFKFSFVLMLLLLALAVSACTTNTAATEPATEAVTEAADPAATEAATEAQTEAATEAPVEFAKATKEDVQSAFGDAGAIVVDARQNDAYIGWKLDGVQRGGHIEGAVDFAANWLTTENEKRDQVLEEALAAKGITTDKKVIVYDANGTDAQAVATYLAGKGFANIALYDVNEWAADESLGMTQYANYQLLVPPQIVKEITEGKKPESFENAKEIKIVEGSWGTIDGPAEEASPYAMGHIAGSPHINTDSLEPPPAWMLADDETLIKVANDYGFTPEDTVIVTGKDTLAMYRVAYVLRYMGIQDVRVLNGGLAAWERLGYPLVKETTEPTPGTAYTSGDQFNKDLVTTQDELKGLLGTEGYVLVDNRTWEEHIGNDSGYSYHDKKGRIPGAIYGYAGKAGEGSSSVTYFQNIDKTMRRAEEIKELWESQGIDLNTKRIDAMCGSGWRVAEIAYYFHTMGYDNVKMYSDGWIGWSTNPDHPTETGVPDLKPKY